MTYIDYGDIMVYGILPGFCIGIVVAMVCLRGA